MSRKTLKTVEQLNQQTLLESKEVVALLITQYAHAILERLDKELENVRRHFIRTHTEAFQEEMGKVNARVDAALSRIIGIIDQYDKNIKKSQQIIETAEQTLCNVLLAIRQNEYLHAWYPAQGGEPEQKVVGRHPLQEKI